MLFLFILCFFFFKQKTAYEMRISDWSSDVCSSDLDEADAAGITKLRHVRSAEEKRTAEEIANRTPCEDFDRFKPLFEQAANDLKAGVRETRPFGKDASVSTGDFFILGGQTVYVAEKIGRAHV